MLLVSKAMNRQVQVEITVVVRPTVPLLSNLLRTEVTSEALPQGEALHLVGGTGAFQLEVMRNGKLRQLPPGSIGIRVIVHGMSVAIMSIMPHGTKFIIMMTIISKSIKLMNQLLDTSYIIPLNLI